MAKLLVKRLMQTIPLLFGISIFSFLIVALAPGDPLSHLMTNPHISRETIEALRHQLGLDVPVHIRYWRWLNGLLQGDWGLSLQYQVPVSTLLSTRLINTLILSLSATLVAIIVGVPLGVLAAVRRGRLTDHLCNLLATTSLSTPRIFLALLALLLAAKTGWFPLGGQYSTSFDRLTGFERVIDALHHLVLPALILSLSPLAIYLRQMRGNLLDTLEDDHVIIARAKGLSELAVITKHALRSALNPVITLFGFSIGNLLSGSALVETIMAWPGIGKMTVEAVFARDTYVLMAAVMITSVLLIIGNLIADILVGLNDPRIASEAQG
jgi:peptide/nickel transport system permease protein